MPALKNTLVLYTDPSRLPIIQSFDARNPALTMVPVRVNHKECVADQFSRLRALASDPGGDIGGVIGTNDFASALAAAVSEEMGFATPLLTAIYQAQHKALFAAHAAACSDHFQPTKILTSAVDIPTASQWYPGFIKPAAGSLSNRAYRVEDPRDLKTRYSQVSSIHPPDVHWREELFAPLIQTGDPSISAFLLQPYYQFPQFTADAYVHQGKLTWVGITASIFDPPGHSFERFDFPADISAAAQAELDEIIRCIIERIGYDNGCLNVEFFVTGEDHIALIEFNTRQAFQFVPLFTARFSGDYLTAACQLALGVEPDLQPLPQPRFASSCVLRVYQDAEVIAVPSQTAIREAVVDGLVHSVRLLAQPGRRLSDNKQDEYSFRYALFNIVGDDLNDVKRKLTVARERLPFQLKF